MKRIKKALAWALAGVMALSVQAPAAFAMEQKPNDSVWGDVPAYLMQNESINIHVTKPEGTETMDVQGTVDGVRVEVPYWPFEEKMPVEKNEADYEDISLAGGQSLHLYAKGYIDDCGIWEAERAIPCVQESDGIATLTVSGERVEPTGREREVTVQCKDGSYLYLFDGNQWKWYGMPAGEYRTTIRLNADGTYAIAAIVYDEDENEHYTNVVVVEATSEGQVGTVEFASDDDVTVERFDYATFEFKECENADHYWVRLYRAKAWENGYRDEPVGVWMVNEANKVVIDTNNLESPGTYYVQGYAAGDGYSARATNFPIKLYVEPQEVHDMYSITMNASADKVLTGTPIHFTMDAMGGVDTMTMYADNGTGKVMLAEWHDWYTIQNHECTFEQEGTYNVWLEVKFYDVEDIVSSDPIKITVFGNEPAPAETTTRTYSIIWNDSNDKDGIRPDEVFARFGGMPISIGAKGEWKIEMTDLPKYDEEGQEIKYNISLSDVKCYDMERTDNENGATFTFTLNHKQLKQLGGVVADCTHEGVTPSEWCDECGAVITPAETIPVDPDAHDWGEWEVTTPATEEAPGEETRVCKNNPEHIETHEIQQLEHAHLLDAAEEVPATCEKEGIKAHYKCASCGKIYLDAECTQEVTEADLVIKALGHEWGEWKVTKKATTSAKGEEQRVCKHDPAHVETRAIAKLKSISKATVSGIKTSYTYTGKAIKPSVTVKLGKTTLKAGTDYKVSYSSNTKVGTAKVKITGIGKYADAITKTFKITKASQPMTVKAKAVTLKYSTLKSKAQTIKVGKYATISKEQGKLSYAISSKGKLSGVKIAKSTGKITVPKKTKKGTYTIKVKVTAAGNSNYKSGSKTVSVKITVK